MDLVSQPIDRLRIDADKCSVFLLEAGRELDRLHRELAEGGALRTKILPRELERLRLSRESDDLAPDDTRGQLLIAGQINEVKYLMGTPKRTQNAITFTEQEISKASARLEKLTKKLRRKERYAGSSPAS